METNGDIFSISRFQESILEAQPASSKDHDTGFGDSRDALAQL